MYLDLLYLLAMYLDFLYLLYSLAMYLNPFDYI